MDRPAVVIDEITGEPISTEIDPCPNCGCSTCQCEQCMECNEWRYPWVEKCMSKFCRVEEEENE